MEEFSLFLQCLRPAYLIFNKNHVSKVIELTSWWMMFGGSVSSLIFFIVIMQNETPINMTQTCLFSGQLSEQQICNALSWKFTKSCALMHFPCLFLSVLINLSCTMCTISLMCILPAKKVAI